MPIIIYLLLFIILLGVILIFSSKRFSPIPYFPTQKIDLPLIIKSLYLKSDQLIVDLGAGDGIVIFEAAKEAYKKKLNTEFLAVEINPILILLLRLRRYFHPNKKSIKILKADIFNMNFKNLSFPRKRESILSWIPHQVRNDSQKVEQYNNVTIYLYISPWFLDQVTQKILKEFPKARVVSYMYPIKSLKKKPHFAFRSLRGKEKIIRGKNSIFIYS